MQKRATGDYPSDEISFRLHEAAYRNQEAADRNQQAVEAAIRKMRETDEIIRQRIQTLPDWVAGEVDKRLKKTVDDAAKEITANVTASLKAENEAANRAKVRYENAVKFSVRKVVGTALGCFAIGCIGMITGVYVAACLILPAPDVLQREREAEQNVEKLAPRGGNSILRMCKTEKGDSRQCVRTDERGRPTPFEAGEETYRIIYGY